MIADAQMGDVIVVCRHHKFAIDLADKHFRNNIHVVIGKKLPARTGLKIGDSLERFLNVVQITTQNASDFRDSAFAQGIETFRDNLILQGVLKLPALELKHQTFT